MGRCDEDSGPPLKQQLRELAVVAQSNRCCQSNTKVSSKAVEPLGRECWRSRRSKAGPERAAQITLSPFGRNLVPESSQWPRADSARACPVSRVKLDGRPRMAPRGPPVTSRARALLCTSRTKRAKQQSTQGAWLTMPLKLA